MERAAAGSEQGTPDSEMGDGDGDSVGYGTEMELDPSSSAYPARPSVHDGVDPYEGMEFDDEEDAWTFYNLYARRVGFSTRISVMHRSRRDGSIMSRQFVCAKEGFRTYRGKHDAALSPGAGDDAGRGAAGRRTRAVTRVGCKAMIRVKKQDAGKWAITKLETAHNHPLVPQNQAHCLRPHKPLSECGKQRSSSSSSYGVRRNGGMFLTIEPPPPTPPVPQTTSIIAAQPLAPHYISADGIGNATRVILDYVKRMQAEDPAFFYAMQFVEGHPVGNVFWSDARARTAYKDFGDAVFLDDHCKRSKHELPLVTFTGVNHHCQPVLFGCAVIRDNSEASFAWLFETLLLAMSGQHPVSLTTEYDGAIQSAVHKVLPQTRHRFCSLHILNEAQCKLSDLLTAFPSLYDELVSCINMSDTIDEFEANWEALISKVGSGHNEWLDSMYNCRRQWVPVYLRDTFFGDEPSRQGCMSRSSFFESHITAKTNLQSFIQHYEKALDSCYEREVKEEFETKYSLPDIKTSSPIEKQGADLYTRTLFLRFQQELVGASVCTLEVAEEDGKACMYKVTTSQGSEKPRMVQFNSSDSSAKCTCQMFEYLGIVCRHILTVFGAQGISTLPSQCIVKRWTKNATDRSSDKKPDEVIRVKELKEEQRSTVEDGEQSQTWRYNSLCREALRYAEEGASSTEVYIVAMQALQEAANKVNMAKRAIGQVAPLAVMPITAQAPESAGKFYDGFGQQKKRKRNSNNSRENSAPNQFMHMQQPSSYLFVGPSTSGGSQGPSQLVAAIPVSSCAQHGQTSGANNSTDGNMTTTSVAVDKFHGFSGRDAPTTAPSSGNVVQAGETKSSGVPSQINEIHELSQANGNKGGSVNMVNSTASPQLVTVPIGFCLSSMDNSKMSAVGMSSTNSGGMTSNGNASFGIRQCQSSAQAPATHSEAKPPAENTDSRATTADSSSIRAAAIAAGARIASPSDAASIIKAAQSKDAIHIRPGESLPNQLKPLAPRPLSSLAPSSAQHLQQPGQNSSFGDSTAAKEAIFGSTDGSDGEEYYDDDDEDTDDGGDDDNEGLTGDEGEQE
ncbi:protein FAR1-RELATED SEQUENCE 5-like [Hordeum vulgare subsp. vulgare]|uniref:SWIM-type domain-containing protein n=1 Tax=Hordeum vulgare subsp. vulgare TaxID=112509 RepID=A0A8I6WXX7_HORVV|nr:protein FAR1-RELATED SEQUENCE 5-like [Hordeum vulgare subsp. vulgare]